MSVLEEISQDSNHWLGTFGPLVVVIWTTGSIDAKVCERMLELSREITKRSGGERPSVISITCPTLLGPPSSRSRRALTELVEAGSDVANRVAVVLEGRGFIVSCALSVISGIQMLVRPRCGYRFFTSLGDALRWCTENLSAFQSGAIRYEAARATIERQSKRMTTEWIAKSAVRPPEVKPRRPLSDRPRP